MSRKGKLPIPLPKGITVTVKDGVVTVAGPKGTLHQNLLPGILIDVQSGQLEVGLAEEQADQGHNHGLYRSLLANMVLGTSQAFEKKLELVGVGYRAAVQGQLLDLLLGYSHPTKIAIPQGITVKVEKNIITISGIDKQSVGQFAADIRSMRPPEPYQGKGVRYVGEYVRRKAGKTAKK